MTLGTEAIEAHIAEVFACRRCPTVQGPPVFGPSPGSRILLVGQAPGPKERDRRRPFAYTAGKTLFSWFARAGWTEQETRRRVWFSAVIRCFPGRNPGGGDRAPSAREIANCSPYIFREIELLRPKLIIPVGRLAIALFLRSQTLGETVGRSFRKTVRGVPTEVLPLPHPSGRSTWVNAPVNRRRLEKALRLLRRRLTLNRAAGVGA